MAAAEDEPLLPRLPELFETSRKLLEEVEAATEPTGSRTVQEKVMKGLGLLEKAAEMLSQLDLFSGNEGLEEAASSDLKYLMVPAFRGALTVRRVGPGARLDHLQQAREHFMNYLTQCHHYHVAEFRLPATESDSAEDRAAPSAAGRDLVALAARRQAKIERERQKREAERKLSALKAAVESGGADEERVREYHLLHLRRWVAVSLDEIESIDQEIKILRKTDRSREAAASRPSLQDRPAVKPFVLTRNQAEARVFGAGYPSLATMTVSDWYEQQRKYGALPGQGGAGPSAAEFQRAAQQQEEREQEDDDDDDDEEEKKLGRVREWDDWKDSHPRGYGNRQNMG